MSAGLHYCPHYLSNMFLHCIEDSVSGIDKVTMRSDCSVFKRMVNLYGEMA